MLEARVKEWESSRAGSAHKTHAEVMRVERVQAQLVEARALEATLRAQLAAAHRQVGLHQIMITR
jgi:hypothetical protein